MRETRKKSKKFNKFLLIVLILLIIGAICLYFYNLFNNSKTPEEPVSSGEIVEPEPIPEDINITMSVIGDIMCHNTQYNDAYVKASDTYDFSYVFSDIQKYIQVADIAVGNLETTFAGKDRGYSNYPTFNTPEQLAGNLKTLGVDVLSTANNHSLDKGYKGLVSTLDFLDNAGIAHTGTYRTAEEQNQITIQNVNGITMAFLSFTYGTNGIPVPSGKDYCVNLIDKDLIVKQIDLAKQHNPDMICVFMHWGLEYKTKQNSTQEDLADFLFQNGVDVILGGHPHVVQPMEKREITLPDGTKKDGFVIYSLGNFISGQKDLDTKSSAILNIGITKDGETGKISVDTATYIPVYMYRSTNTSILHRFRLFDIRTSMAKYESGEDTSIGKSLYNTLKQSLDFTCNILGDEILLKEVSSDEVTSPDNSSNVTE